VAHAGVVPSQIGDDVLGHLGDASSELGQVLAVLAAAGWEHPEAMRVGEGDRRLLALVHHLAGRYPELTVACPDCGEVNSVVLGPEWLPDAVAVSAWWGPGGGLRQPTYADLLALAPLLEAGLDAGAVGAELLARCTVGHPPAPATADDLARIDDALSGPLAIACVGCGRELVADVDLEALALEGLAARARDVDLEVHLLASAYHWELATIEALPDRRRRRLAALVVDGR